VEGDRAPDAAATPESTPVADASAEVIDPGISSAEGAVADASTDASEGAGDTAEAAAPTADDDADLARYPESVREDFRKLSPEKRKALFEHAEANARLGWEALKKREADLAAETTRKAEQTKAVLSKTGKFVGAEAQTLTRKDGSTQELPSYDDLAKLSQTRSGRDELYQKYGLDEVAAEELRDEWDQRYEMLEEAGDLIETQRLAKIDQRMRAGFKAVDLDPDAYLGAVSVPEEIVPAVVRALREQHEAEVKTLKSKHADEIKLHAVNAEGLRARALAGDSPPIPTGGRTAGATAMTLDQFRAMPLEERKRLRADNPALVDRLYAQGARPI
jgi:hypothetical protein